MPKQLAPSSSSSSLEAMQLPNLQTQWNFLKLCRSSFFLCLVSATLMYNVFRDQHKFSGVLSNGVIQNQGISSSAMGRNMQELSQQAQQQQQQAHAQLQQQPAAHSSSLPSCPALMQMPNSPFKDGAFLTRHTIPIHWVPRHDGSRELKHSMCDIHRYTAQEARRCLAGKHVNVIGDSLSRYQYMSLAWFLHKGSWPPHFGRPAKEWMNCTHHDEHGHKTCSPDDQPNICMEGDWNRANPKGDAWKWLMQSVGDKLFDGRLESNAIRTKQTKDDNVAENYIYVSPPDDNDSDNSNQKDPKEIQKTIRQTNRFVLSYFKETGWNDDPRPLNGFDFTGCAYKGTCTYDDDLSQARLARALNRSWDFSQPLAKALNKTERGILHTLIPPVDITLYNRGLWGTLTPARAAQTLPLLFALSQGDKGRCYYRATTGKFQKTREQERSYVRLETSRAGCGYIDFAHILDDFNQMIFLHPRPPSQNTATDGYTALDERLNVYWDAVHFMPWVYEELNNLLLNLWCNTQLPLSEESDSSSSAASA